MNRRFSKRAIGRMIPVVLALAISLPVTPVFGQGGPMMAEFEANAPKVGESLPDVTVFDHLGNPVNIRELPGENYKVLVLGCLT